jgi:hypothetical protein
MAKLTLFPALLVAACIVAGVYGALHNQISYSERRRSASLRYGAFQRWSSG